MLLVEDQMLFLKETYYQAIVMLFVELNFPIEKKIKISRILFKIKI